MQHDKLELSAQQMVLAFLGFYNGAIDGVWSDATIRAMKAFECDDKFLPAVPTFGLPFRLNCRLPKGMYWDKRLVGHRDLTPDVARALLEKRSRKAEPVQQTPVQQDPVTTEPEAEPVVEKEAPVTQTQDSAKGNKHAQK